MKSNTNSNTNEFEQFFIAAQVPDPVAECDECEATFVGDWRTVSRNSSLQKFTVIKMGKFMNLTNKWWWILVDIYIYIYYICMYINMEKTHQKKQEILQLCTVGGCWYVLIWRCFWAQSSPGFRAPSFAESWGASLWSPGRGILGLLGLYWT